MPNMFIKKLCILTLFTCMASTSFAWGVLGHRIVGEIADQQLSRTARKAIKEILGTESIAMSSNWADFVKSDPAYNYLYNWHFVNLQSGLTCDQVHQYLQSDTATDAYTKMIFLTDALKNKLLEPETKRLYLRVLIHIAGDLHQPMHTGRLEDLGGNKIRVLWFKDSSNLHQVWDEKLINFQQLSYTEYTRAIQSTDKQFIKKTMQEPILTWICQSYEQAEKIYAYIQKPFQKLDYRYNYDHYELLNKQLLLGGLHLAGLLNEIFK